MLDAQDFVFRLMLLLSFGVLQKTYSRKQEEGREMLDCEAFVFGLMRFAPFRVITENIF